MKKILLSTTAVFALAANAGFAQSIAEQVITQLQAEGYERIEVKNGPTQVKVEAIRNGMKLEVVYDAATGAVIDALHAGAKLLGRDLNLRDVKRFLQRAESLQGLPIFH